MLGYCQVVHATAHIMSQITVKHLGNYKLSPVNKLVDTRMRRNVNRNGFNGGCRGVGNVNIPHSNQGPQLTRACAETSIGMDLTPEKCKRYNVLAILTCSKGHSKSHPRKLGLLFVKQNYNFNGSDSWRARTALADIVTFSNSRERINNVNIVISK